MGHPHLRFSADTARRRHIFEPAREGVAHVKAPPLRDPRPRRGRHVLAPRDPSDSATLPTLLVRPRCALPVSLIHAKAPLTHSREGAAHT